MKQLVIEFFKYVVVGGFALFLTTFAYLHILEMLGI